MPSSSHRVVTWMSHVSSKRKVQQGDGLHLEAVRMKIFRTATNVQPHTQLLCQNTQQEFRYSANSLVNLKNKSS